MEGELRREAEARVRDLEAGIAALRDRARALLDDLGRQRCGLCSSAGCVLPLSPHPFPNRDVAEGEREQLRGWLGRAGEGLLAQLNTCTHPTS